MFHVTETCLLGLQQFAYKWLCFLYLFEQRDDYTEAYPS